MTFRFHRVKVVVVGNITVGKTSLITTLSYGFFPRDNLRFVMDFHITDLIVDGKYVELAPWDTPGESEVYERLRPLSYPSTDVFLLCFSLNSWQSYNDISIRWYPELTHHCPNTPIILVGTKLDLREDQEIAEQQLEQHGGQQPGDKLISMSDGLKLVSDNPNVVKYMECSALTQFRVVEVFEEAARIALKQQRRQVSTCCTFL